MIELNNRVAALINKIKMLYQTKGEQLVISNKGQTASNIKQRVKVKQYLNSLKSNY